MKHNLNEIYAANVFGKPSIHLDALNPPVAKGQEVINEREQVINTYLPARMHVKKGSTQQAQAQRNSLKEKYEANNVESQFVTFLESYFQSNRSSNLRNIEEVIEDMYSYHRETQQ